MTRAVLDANVYVSGIVGAGVPRKILRATLGQHGSQVFQLVASRAILDEIGRVLRYPKIRRRNG